MHPIVIVASDKDPAIGAAVETLQAAGFEVRVLNTATAKLVDFLGALAGDDGDDEEKPQDETPEDPKDENAELPPVMDTEPEDPNDPLDPKKMEALIDGEPVLVEIVDGAQITLHPNKIWLGAKTTYSLNESQFSFWPTAVSTELVIGGVDLVLDGKQTGHLTPVIFSEEAATPPVLKIGRDWLATRE